MKINSILTSILMLILIIFNLDGMENLSWKSTNQSPRMSFIYNARNDRLSDESKYTQKEYNAILLANQNRISLKHAHHIYFDGEFYYFYDYFLSIPYYKSDILNGSLKIHKDEADRLIKLYKSNSPQAHRELILQEALVTCQ